jgi:ribosomal-protein-serine acetyltransferase
MSEMRKSELPLQKYNLFHKTLPGPRRESSLDIRIRPYMLDDASALFDATQESLAELRAWMPWPSCYPEYSIEQSSSLLEVQVAAFQEGSAFEFAIVSADGGYLGGCGLHQIDKANHQANLGYWVRSTAVGRGIATTAVQLIRNWGFQNADLLRLELVIAVGNRASHRVAEKSGATREGKLRNWLPLHGTLHDATIFSFKHTKHMGSLGVLSKSHPVAYPEFPTVGGWRDHEPP